MWGFRGAALLPWQGKLSGVEFKERGPERCQAEQPGVPAYLVLNLELVGPRPVQLGLLTGKGREVAATSS